jgi:hypothetical protein
MRLFASLIVLAFASPALAEGNDKNWGDKQVREKAGPSKMHEKNGTFPLEKEKMQPMKSERKK